MSAIYSMFEKGPGGNEKTTQHLVINKEENKQTRGWLKKYVVKMNQQNIDKEMIKVTLDTIAKTPWFPNLNNLKRILVHFK